MCGFWSWPKCDQIAHGGYQDRIPHLTWMCWTIWGPHTILHFLWKMYCVLAYLAVAHLRFSIPVAHIVLLATVPYHLLWGRRFFSVPVHYLLWVISYLSWRSSRHKSRVSWNSGSCPECLQWGSSLLFHLLFFFTNSGWEAYKRCLPIIFHLHVPVNKRLGRIHFQCSELLWCHSLL